MKPTGLDDPIWNEFIEGDAAKGHTYPAGAPYESRETVDRSGKQYYEEEESFDAVDLIHGYGFIFAGFWLLLSCFNFDGSLLGGFFGYLLSMGILFGPLLMLFIAFKQPLNRWKKQ